MRRSAARSCVRTIAALLALAASAALPAHAGSDGETPRAPGGVEKTFLIPTSDGYGVGDCLSAAGSECGQVVANAWCEAQGFAMAGSYGIALPEEYTGAIDLPVSKPSERPIRITCRD